jgi:hypothetical protein
LERDKALLTSLGDMDTGVIERFFRDNPELKERLLNA